MKTMYLDNSLEQFVLENIREMGEWLEGVWSRERRSAVTDQYLQGMNFGFHDFPSEIPSSITKSQMGCVFSPQRENMKP